VLRKVIRKGKEIYYNELLSLSTNKSKTYWNVIYNEIGTASSKHFSQTESKHCNKNINIYLPAKISNNYVTNCVDELITYQPKTESAMCSLTELFRYEFPHIISIPMNETEVICTISSLKNKTLCGYGGLSNKILKLCGRQIFKPLTYVYN